MEQGFLTFLFLLYTATSRRRHHLQLFNSDPIFSPVSRHQLHSASAKPPPETRCRDHPSSLRLRCCFSCPAGASSCRCPCNFDGFSTNAPLNAPPPQTYCAQRGINESRRLDTQKSSPAPRRPPSCGHRGRSSASWRPQSSGLTLATVRPRGKHWVV